MTGEYFLHLFHGTVSIMHVPVVSVPANDEPDVLRSIQLLLVRLKQPLKPFLATQIKRFLFSYFNFMITKLVIKHESQKTNEGAPSGAQRRRRIQCQ